MLPAICDRFRATSPLSRLPWVLPLPLYPDLHHGTCFVLGMNMIPGHSYRCIRNLVFRHPFITLAFRVSKSNSIPGTLLCLYTRTTSTLYVQVALCRRLLYDINIHTRRSTRDRADIYLLVAACGQSRERSHEIPGISNNLLSLFRADCHD